MNDTRSLLREIYVKALRLECAPETLPDSNLSAELGIDSVSALEVLIWVENEFGFEIEDSALSITLIDSLDTLVQYVEKRLAAGTPDVVSEAR